MSGIPENTKSITVSVLVGNKSGLELIFVVITVKHSFVVLCLNAGFGCAGTELVNEGKSSQNSHHSTNDRGMPNIGKNGRTEDQLSECQNPVNAIAQHGMHGFEVKRVTDVELDAVHGWFLLVSLFLTVAERVVAQVCKEPEHFRLASAT